MRTLGTDEWFREVWVQLCIGIKRGELNTYTKHGPKSFLRNSQITLGPALGKMH